MEPDDTHPSVRGAPEPTRVVGCIPGPSAPVVSAASTFPVRFRADFDPEAIHEALIVSVCDQAREELGDSVSIHWSVRDPAAVGTDGAFDAAAGEIELRVERLSGRVGLPRANV